MSKTARGRRPSAAATRERAARRCPASLSIKRFPASRRPNRSATRRMLSSVASRDPEGTLKTCRPADLRDKTAPRALPSAIASTRSGRSEATFSTPTSIPPTRGSERASGG